jgi:hypothetical protein
MLVLLKLHHPLQAMSRAAFSAWSILVKHAQGGALVAESHLAMALESRVLCGESLGVWKERIKGGTMQVAASELARLEGLVCDLEEGIREGKAASREKLRSIREDRDTLMARYITTLPCGMDRF